MPLLPKRRLGGKQPAPAVYVLPSPATRAIADEGWCELLCLSEDARRKHIHWTMVRTNNPQHRQPHELTQEEFFEHLARVYREVYPEPANRHGSILLFGLVVSERHAQSAKEILRDLHHHGATYSSKQHFWRLIAQRSLEHYRIKLHAACHDCYATMFVYLRHSSPKKPAAEIDPSPYLSPDHPRGDELKRLLEASSSSCRARAGHVSRKRSDAPDAPGAEEHQRFRAKDLFSLVGRTGIRTAPALQAHAATLATSGNTMLAEFCTVQGPSLQQFIDSAWSVHEAPTRLAVQAGGLMGKFRTAAAAPCECGGVWAPGALKVLVNNNEDVGVFCRDVCTAIALDCRRGVNMALIGGPGMGKSMIFESMADIFKVSGRPERDSTFPLAGILEAEVLVWHEFAYHKKALAWEDLLAVLAHEIVGIRVPCAKPVQHRNAAPMFYTARKLVAYVSQDAQEMIDYNQAMTERFKIRRWLIPFPMHLRQVDFPRCGPCSARFFLESAT